MNNRGATRSQATTAGERTMTESTATMPRNSSMQPVVPGTISWSRLGLMMVMALSWLSPSTASADTPRGHATLVVRNVHGYTPTNNGTLTFQGLVVVDGKVTRLLRGSADAPRVPGATEIDGQGKTLLPGLIDAHGHVLTLGEEKAQADLRNGVSLTETLERVRKFAAAHEDAPWVIGLGWNQALWKGQQFPSARDLDAVVSDRPAALTRIDLHAIWVNSAALRLAGINANTPDPTGGQILRDASGQPTGVLVDSAMALIRSHIPPATDARSRQAMQDALLELASLGITGVHDASVDARQYGLYETLGRAGRLPIRIYAMLMDSEAARTMIAAGPKPSAFDDRLQMRAVKVWLDGSLGSRSAAMLQGYHDLPASRGLLRYTSESLRALATLAAQRGWQLNLHAIGDAANRLALDTLESQLTARQRSELRPRIEHAQVIALADLPRFARLGVIASIQPTHATSDMNMAEDRVGHERIQGAYAWRKLLNSGARLAGGSDFPVELANPFHGLYAAVTRTDRNGQPPGGWYPQEKLTRDEALRLFTLDAAYASHMERIVGSLEPGKWADFILVDSDYFQVPEAQIDDLKVLATYVAGQRVWPKPLEQDPS